VSFLSVILSECGTQKVPDQLQMMKRIQHECVYAQVGPEIIMFAYRCTQIFEFHSCW